MQQIETPSPSAGRKSSGVQLSTPAFFGLLVMVVLPWALIVLGRLPNPLGGLLQRSLQAVSGSESTGEFRSGPWGSLELNDIAISPVDILVPGQPGTALPIQWFFENFSAPQLNAWLDSLGLTPRQRADLLSTNAWALAPGGILLHPSGETILELAPDVRARLYDVLGTSSANREYFQPWSMKTALFEKRLAHSGLNPETQELVRRLAYCRGSRTFISDVAVILNRLGDVEEKRDVLRLLSSASTYQVKLVVPPGADTSAMAAYWGGQSRRKDFKPILESLSQLPAGGKLDIAHLLPAFARQRLYVYPNPTLAQDGVRRDCHWTSLNFFSPVPDDRFGDAAEATRFILANYYQTGESPQYGDLALLTLPDGNSIHSCVVLAGNLAFTKNGENPDQPWIIMDIDELRDLYGQYYRTTLGVQYWRRK